MLLKPRRLLAAGWLAALLLLTLPAALAAAPDSAAATRPVPADQTPTLRLRRPDAGRLRELRQQRDFRYVEVKSELSAWDLMWLRFWRWVAEVLATPSGRFAWKYGLYAFLVAALVFAVLKLLQVDLTRAFGRAPRRAALSYDTETEDLHALQLDALLAQAETERNYRLAVRLGYLQVLRQLSDTGLIRWQPDKTNHDYLFELPAGPLPEAFRELTRQFEYVWYGEQEDLTTDDYERVRATRLAFQRRLTPTRHAA
ncbi:DUF4129 domain-containing protein [Hymenobacter weizhouensis]|uniref:DUF4129 domain-containing protein n=1 Tax=Hymenobacter sp. YIM 151500-1 TaxID=2987689 RepID=UPI00222636CF|nr:DUF4129 domain-containing protein [Hymenobacter sp. YIM 151500-1]UYZ63340.1 DUF4129 domain-containing protein [Hymenobacter sp. YIM 151500-1]